jgi:amino acid transporter
MFASVRRLLFGPPLATARQLHERLPKYLALPVFSSDAVSSVAYGPEEVLIALAIVGPVAWGISLPIGICIAGLIAIVSISYRQTIFAYPHGGGSYTVAKENLGILPGLIAAASLLTDYVLTVAVSIAAGIQALVAAFPGLAPYTVEACVAAVGLVALANLRGLRESGALFAPPTYAFIAGLFILVFKGLYVSIFGSDHGHIVPANYLAGAGGVLDGIAQVVVLLGQLQAQLVHQVFVIGRRKRIGVVIKFGGQEVEQPALRARVYQSS